MSSNPSYDGSDDRGLGGLVAGLIMGAVGALIVAPMGDARGHTPMESGKIERWSTRLAQWVSATLWFVGLPTLLLWQCSQASGPLMGATSGAFAALSLPAGVWMWTRRVVAAQTGWSLATCGGILPTLKRAMPTMRDQVLFWSPPALLLVIGGALSSVTSVGQIVGALGIVLIAVRTHMMAGATSGRISRRSALRDSVRAAVSRAAGLSPDEIIDIPGGGPNGIAIRFTPALRIAVARPDFERALLVALPGMEIDPDSLTPGARALVIRPETAEGAARREREAAFDGLVTDLDGDGVPDVEGFEATMPSPIVATVDQSAIDLDLRGGAL
jgi:hypothetical protein